MNSGGIWHWERKSLFVHDSRWNLPVTVLYQAGQHLKTGLKWKNVRWWMPVEIRVCRRNHQLIRSAEGYWWISRVAVAVINPTGQLSIINIINTHVNKVWCIPTDLIALFHKLSPFLPCCEDNMIAAYQVLFSVLNWIGESCRSTSATEDTK